MTVLDALVQSEIIVVTMFLTVVGLVFYLDVRVLIPIIWRATGRRATPSTKARLRSPSVLVLVTVSVLGGTCVAYGFLVEPGLIEETRHEVTINRLPKLDTLLKLVQLSDLHVSGPDSRLNRVALRVREIQPDLLLMTGDYLNSPRGVPALSSFLTSLDMAGRIYAVEGNFDWHGTGWYEAMAAGGVRILEDEKVELSVRGYDICLIGSRASLKIREGLLDGSKEDHVNVFMVHHPSAIPQVAGNEADLILCGHTHGGQVRLPFYGALVTLSATGKRFEAGMYELGETRAYVNRGVGTEPYGRVRFMCRPEVAVFNINGRGDISPIQ
ncbi:metallophosphoesterase [Candidatus Hydrogenedentota bacterium]